MYGIVGENGSGWGRGGCIGSGKVYWVVYCVVSCTQYIDIYDITRTGSTTLTNFSCKCKWFFSRHLFPQSTQDNERVQLFDLLTVVFEDNSLNPFREKGYSLMFHEFETRINCL